MVVRLQAEQVESYAYQLKKYSFLRVLELSNIKKLLFLGEYFHLPSGYILIKQGEKSGDFFIILKGELIASKQTTPDSCPIEIARIPQNNTVGEIGCILNEARTSTVTSNKNTHVLRYDNDTFNVILNTIPQFRRALFMDLAKRLEECYTRQH